MDRCCSDPVPSGPPSTGHRDDELRQAPAGGRLPARSEMRLRGGGWQVTAAGHIQSPRPGHTSDRGGRPRSTPSALQPAAALSLTLHTMGNLPVKVTNRFRSALAQYLRSHGRMSECPHAHLGAQRSSGIAHRTPHGSVTAPTQDKTQAERGHGPNTQNQNVKRLMNSRGTDKREGASQVFEEPSAI